MSEYTHVLLLCANLETTPFTKFLLNENNDSILVTLE